MQDNNIHISLLVIINNLISYCLTQNMCSKGVVPIIIYSPPVKLTYNTCLALETVFSPSSPESVIANGQSDKQLLHFRVTDLKAGVEGTIVFLLCLLKL